MNSEKLKNNNLPKEDKARHDLSTYERSRRRRQLASGAIGLAALGAAAGRAYKKPLIYIPASAAAFWAGFERSKSKREEQASLGRLRRQFDPTTGHNKTAVVGGALEAITSVLGHTGTALQVLPAWASSMTHAVQHAASSSGLPEIASGIISGATPFAVDLAALPYIGKLVQQSTRKHMATAAKDVLGLSLSPAERLLRAKSQTAVARMAETEALQPGFMKNFKSWVDKYRGPRATGGRIGEHAGQILKKVKEYAPDLVDPAIAAMESDEGLKSFQDLLKHRGKTYQEAGQILSETVGDVPYLKNLMAATGRSGETVIKRILQNPEEAKVLANSIRGGVQSSVRGARGAAAALAIAGVGSILANKKPSIFQAKEELSVQAARNAKKEDSTRESSLDAGRVLTLKQKRRASM